MRTSALGLPGQARHAGGEPFQAWVVDAEKGKLKSCELRDFGHVRELPRQDPDATVTVRVHYSDLNYKDAMIIQGRRGVCKGFPIVAGIDFSGVVEESDSPMWSPGDEVVLTGNKVGQHFDGGWAGRCRVQAEWLVPRPRVFSLEETMVIGTAGVTAAQMVVHLEDFGGMAPGSDPVLVTGATGGVGVIAIALLARLGHHVVASTGRVDEFEGYLRELGAAEVIGRLEGDARSQPLQAQKWAHVVDTVGGDTLALALAQTRVGGSVAAVGVAGGGELNGTVYPFVLRGVRLLGVDSTLPWNVAGFTSERADWERHREERLAIWRRLERGLPQEAIEGLHTATAALEEAPVWAERLLAGQMRGRVTIRMP